MNKKIIRNYIKTILKNAIYRIGKLQIGKYCVNLFIEDAMSTYTEVVHNNVHLLISSPNPLTSWRAKTFSEKEPETLSWIDRIPSGSILWDVGANIGLYSVYAAKKNIQVYGFEPSVFNLEILARNLYINKVNDHVTIIPFALSNETKTSIMRFTTTEWGGALSTFDKNFGWDGRAIKEVFSYQTFGVKADLLFDDMGIRAPEYLKIDVDGIEHLILEGAIKILSKVKEILIEVNDDFEGQASGVQNILLTSGFKLREKSHSEMIENSKSGFANSYNQIWVR